MPWQRTSPVAVGVSPGISLRQRSSANGQRGWKWQPSGGLIGLGAAWMGAKILANMPEDAQVPDPVISPLIIFIAFAVTVGTGVFFGYYPAWQASRLDPIEALRSSR